MFRYSVYGVTVDSELEIPELCESDHGLADVVVSLGDVAEHLPDAIRRGQWFEHNRNACLFKVRDIARYLVSEGRSIRVDRRIDRNRQPGCGAPAADIRLYLLGSAFGALLHQRGWLPLHVSAVDTGSGVWAFTGPSGAGKSTLAGWFHRTLNWPILSDDVSVIKPQEGRPVIYPGPRKLKLWRDAINHLGCADEKLSQDLSNTDKFQLFLNETVAVESAVLKGLVVLEQCPANQPPGLRRLKGLDALKACRLAVYRPYMERCFRNRAEFLEDLINLARRIEVYCFRRHWSLPNMTEQMEPLLQTLMAHQPAKV